MIIRYNGALSSPVSLPGGGPQGTLLGLLLFLVLINDIGFVGQSNDLGDIITIKKKMKELNEIHRIWNNRIRWFFLLKTIGSYSMMAL